MYSAIAFYCRKDVEQAFQSDEVTEVYLQGCTGIQDALEDLLELKEHHPAVPSRDLHNLEWYRIYRDVSEAPTQFGLGDYLPSVAAYLVEAFPDAQGQRGPSGGLTLSSNDARALGPGDHLSSMAAYLVEAFPDARGQGGPSGGLTLSSNDARALSALRIRNLKCFTSRVGCGIVRGELRVLALAVQSNADPRVWQHLSNLTELRALHLRAPVSKFVDELFLPNLEALELAELNVRSHCPHAERLFGEVIGRHAKLRVISIIPDKYREFNFTLESWCGLTQLRDMHLPDMNIYSFPQCFSEMRDLRNVYVSCNYLTRPPVALANLPELRSFVAFRQGEWTPCHFEGAKKPATLKHEKEANCKLTWESKCGLDGDDNTRILCPSISLHGTLQDFMNLGWYKLEKLWLDGNFLNGTIPHHLPQVWPNLSSLDLYNNELTGAIPASLALLPFQKLQLQDNHLVGEVPPDLFELPICYFNLAGNPGLRGCFRAGRMLRMADGNELLSFPGTGTRSCNELEMSEGRTRRDEI